MKALHAIAFILVAIGAVNWGLVGIGGWNVVDMLIGKWEIVERAVYVLVGLSGLFLVFTHKKDCKHCETAPVVQATM